MMMHQTYIKVRGSILLSLAVLSLAIVFASCGGDDGPSQTPQEIAQELLETTWTMTAITLDGSDVSDSYTGLTITIGDGTFTTTNAGDLFPATGTWDWIGETNNMIRTGRGKEITLNTLNETSTILSFLKTTGNQAAGISGSYVITMSN